MRKGGRLFILLGISLALVAVILGVFAFSGDGEPAAGEAAKIDTVPVIETVRDVSANTVLTEDDVEVVEVDKTTISPGSATSVGQVIGLASNGDMIKGQRVLLANLVTPGLTYTLADGKRAVAVPIDRINALGGLIRSDDFVDLVYSTRVKLTRVVPSQAADVTDTTTGEFKEEDLKVPPYGTEVEGSYPYPGDPGSRFIVQDPVEGDPVTKIILQDIRVLRVIAGNVTVGADSGATSTEATDATATESSSSAETTPEKLPNSDLLVLEVDPQQAEILKFLQDNAGLFQVLLRSKDDHGVATTEGITYDQLVTDYGLPIPRTVELPAEGQ